MISRKGILLVNTVALASLIASCGGGPAPSGRQVDRVLLITVDGFVPSEMALFGGEVPLPTLESIAADGSAWGDAWTTTPMTRPAVATYLTGVTPDRHGVRDDLFASLPKSRATLARLLGKAGFETAAFPDSSFLGFASGLLEDFDLVDVAPSGSIYGDRWIPSVKPTDQTADHVVAWLQALDEQSSYFGWAHFSEALLRRQLDADEKSLRQQEGELRKRARAKAEGTGDEDPDAIMVVTMMDEPPGESMQAIDKAIGRILAAVEKRGEGERVLVVVAGTQGMSTGDAETPPGPGFSARENALQVPVLVRFPGSASAAGDGPVWAPDVAATVAAWTGIALDDDAEGVSLSNDRAADRVRIAWSWALRDQLGWHPVRAARRADIKQVEGEDPPARAIAGVEETAGAADDAGLVEALQARVDPPPPTVPLEQVREMLEERGLKLDPVAAGGRDFPQGSRRRIIARMLWSARRTMRRGDVGGAVGQYRRVREMDSGALSAILEHGQILAANQIEGALDELAVGVERYPSDPEMLHWYAHGIWRESWEEAEKLLKIVEPHKPQQGDILYDLACARSLAGDVGSSRDYLKQAIDSGYREWHLFETDTDLRNLRQDSGYSQLLSEYGQ